jgi:DNA-binding NtrC family response regulator
MQRSNDRGNEGYQADPRSTPVHRAAPRACVVTFGGALDNASEGKIIESVIQAIDGKLDCSLNAAALVDANADILIPLVTQAHLPAAIAVTAAWQLQHGGGVVLPVVVDLTASQIAELLASGAFDFETFPFNHRAFAVRLRRALGTVPFNPGSRPRTQALSGLGDLIGSSPPFQRALAALPAIAGCDARVLILGETGTGKELYARAIHYNSARSARQMVAVNCGAIPHDLVESELFGHVRGAFSNAYTARAGIVREAEGGTLFLDEIDSLPTAAQVKLLRFLNDMEFRPVGSDAMLRADVRVIAASNQDLPAMVKDGRFRQDLYFRLHVLQVTLPPLRERVQDIGTLALHFAHEFARQHRRPLLGLSPQAMRRLQQYDWPGNVREMRHMIERAVLLAGSSAIQVADLDLQEPPDTDDDDSFRAAKARTVDQFERLYIERLLASCNGNVTHASQLAKKNRRAFFELVRKHHIRPEQFRHPAHATSN